MKVLSRTTIAACLTVAASATFAEGDSDGGFFGPSSWALNPTLHERFTLEGGATFTSVDASVRASRNATGAGGAVDLDDLGIDGDDLSPLLGLKFRFGEKRNWRIAFNYFSHGASGTETASRTFTYDGVTYNAGASIQSDLDTDMFIGMIGWAPFKTDKYELGIGAGAHVASIEMKFQGAGTVNGSTLASATAKTETLAPLPNLWFYGGYAFSPKLSLQGTLGWLSLSIDDYDGEIFTAAGSLEYRFREHLGMGAGYRYLDTNLKVNGSKTTEKYDIDYYGPFVYMSLGF